MSNFRNLEAQIELHNSYKSMRQISHERNFKNFLLSIPIVFVSSSEASNFTRQDIH